MKKILLILVAVFLFQVSNAQSYYTAGKQVTAEGITYNVVGVGKNVLGLENAENTLGKENRLFYKDGTPLEPEKYGQTSAKPKPGVMARIITEVFTKSEYDELRKNSNNVIPLSFYISSEGKIIEVAFILRSMSDIRSIPPAKFAMIEKRLKAELTFTINALAKQLQFMHGGTFWNFSVMDLRYPGDPLQQIDEEPLVNNPLPGDGKPGFEKPPVFVE